MLTEREAALARRAVVARYARLKPSGDPIFCKPSPAELAVARRPPGRAPIVYPDQVAAETAAAELGKLGGLPLVAYECSRSRHGHYHLRLAAAQAGS